MDKLILLCFALCVSCVLSQTSFPLYNAADKGLTMPTIGMGTGYYGMKIEPYGTYPECGDEVHPPWIPGPPAPGCGSNAMLSVLTWLKMGGRRIDTANSYFNLPSVENAIRESGVKREDIFLMSKIGPTYALGYQDAIAQAHDILSTLNTHYLDLLLIHWPSMSHAAPGVPSSDPLCNSSDPNYSEASCRVSTWKAMIYLWKTGLVRSVGVSNYNETHFTEIIDANLPLPSVNQISFNPYLYSGRKSVLEFGNSHNILTVAYSPLGVPDWHPFPTSTGMSASLLDDPVVKQIATAHFKTPAQVLLRWEIQMNAPPNPRSCNATHMLENMRVFDFQLLPSEINALNNLPQDTCEVDPTWYECVGGLPTNL